MNHLLMPFLISLLNHVSRFFKCIKKSSQWAQVQGRRVTDQKLYNKIVRTMNTSNLSVVEHYGT